MKKIIQIMIIVVMCCFILTVPASAETEELLQEQYDAAQTQELMDHLPEGVEEQLEENGIDSPSSENLFNFNIGDFFKNLWDTVVDTVTKPLHLLALCFGIMLLCALLQTMQSTVESSVSQVFTMVSILAISGVLMVPMANCIQYGVETIKGASNFLLCFIPVFTGIVTAAGAPISGLGYHTALFSAIQFISAAVSYIVVPFLGIFLALSVMSSLSGHTYFTKLTSSVKKLVIWGITLLLTIFTAIFSAQAMVSSAADGVTAKTAKFMVSSFVPVVGSALSDALISVKGCLGLVKSSVGSFGVIACILTFLPPILTVLFYMAAVKVSSAAGQVLQLKNLEGIFQAVYDTLSIVLALLISFSVLTIVCTALMVVMGNGGVTS